MEKLRFKTFIWPQNPRVYREEWTREPLYHNENQGTFYDGMGNLRGLISGSGSFSGEEAYQSYQQLRELMDSKLAGTLRHPIFGNRYAYLTALELQQGCREKEVSYRFEFRCAEADGSVPAK